MKGYDSTIKAIGNVCCAGLGWPIVGAAQFSSYVGSCVTAPLPMFAGSLLHAFSHLLLLKEARGNRLVSTRWMKVVCGMGNRWAPKQEYFVDGSTSVLTLGRSNCQQESSLSTSNGMSNSFAHQRSKGGRARPCFHATTAGTAGPSGYGSNSTADQVADDSCCLVPPHLTAIVTGATSGIGAETARVLAKKGIRIVIPARNLVKAFQVKERIMEESPNARIIILEIDLSSFASVRRFCSDFLSLGLPLNILINNAGIFSQELEFSDEKIEMTFAINYLGHSLLTDLLLEKMVESASTSGVEGRIVSVSSVIHGWVKRDSFCFKDMLNPKRYNGTRAYAQSKLANILHAREIARQLKMRNGRVTMNAVHPGIVKTGIIRAHKSLLTDSLYFVASKLLKTIKQGAATTCYVALSPQIQGVSGRYFADCNEVNCSRLANNEDEARRLWRQTNALIYGTVIPRNIQNTEKPNHAHQSKWTIVLSK